LKFGPTTITRICKERWQIEIFFKSLKQLLRVKTFVGTGANALQALMWTALIAMLSGIIELSPLDSQRRQRGRG
jgi:IS4 transposase